MIAPPERPDQAVRPGARLAVVSDVAAALAGAAAAGDVFALWGDLGAGKTTFARAFLRARGHVGEVPSPTFTLVQVYEPGGPAVWHVDLYRIAATADAAELGLDEAFVQAITLLEWPQRLADTLPADRVDVTLALANAADRRDLTVICRGAVAPALAGAVAALSEAG